MLMLIGLSSNFDIWMPSSIEILCDGSTTSIDSKSGCIESILLSRLSLTSAEINGVKDIVIINPARRSVCTRMALNDIGTHWFTIKLRFSRRWPFFTSQ